MSVEVVTGVLVLVLAVATMVMTILGLAGMLGLVRFRRCEQCERMNVVAATNPAPMCVHCEHERLLHPMAAHRHAAHHPHG